jgi:hypothetical protein
MHLTDLIPILQTAISPVILISGVGLLLLSMTNRLGRVVDRTRLLLAALRHSDGSEQVRVRAQLVILSQRARLVRLSITLAGFSVLLAACLVMVLFLTALANLDATLLIAFLFFACLGSLIVALLLFLRDINLSLAALKLELDCVRPDMPKP